MTRRKTTTLLLALLVAFAMTLAFSPVAIAQPHGNTGTIKVHDDLDTEPPRRNVPHVSCEFWIKGFNMSGDSGHIEIRGHPPTDHDRTLVLNVTWTGTEASPHGYDFVAGPFTLDAGHYRVEAFVDDGHPGGKNHPNKIKMFWVDPCPDEEEVPPMECPPLDLRGIANQDTSITVMWDFPEGADGVSLYRAVEDGDFEFIGTFGPETTTYHDTDTELHVTYTYGAAVVFGDRSTEICEMIEVTAIPFFPTLLAGAAAVGLSALAYAGVRRRR